MSFEIERQESQVRYVLSFGDSQRPEKFVFSEAEIKLLFKKLKDVLYGEVKEMP